MEHEKEDNGAAGTIPEFGAIFMSSTVTKKECFKRKIFALPSSKAEFVRHVKTGMILFLFEFEKRQLYGVYQASSDGAVDIVPHAFKYSGKNFPVQVCFTLIWYCDPLSEKEFRDAIRLNYYSPKKFNLGLSKDQVHRLLYLFSSRKLNNRLPRIGLPEADDDIDGKDVGQLIEGSFLLGERGYIDATESDWFKPALFHDCQMKSSNRGKGEEFLIDDGGDAEDNLYPSGQGCFLAKRRRIDSDDRLFRNHVAEIETYNNEVFHGFPIDSPGDYSMVEERRLVNARRLSRIERVLHENEADKFLSPLHHSELLGGLSDIRATDGDWSVHRNKLVSEYNGEPHLGPAFASECYGNASDKSKPQVEWSLYDECVERKHNGYDIIRPTICGHDKVYSCRQSREVIGDHQYSMNGQLESRDYLVSVASQGLSFEHSASLLHELKKATVGEDIPINCRTNFLPSYMKDISSENSAHPLHGDQNLIHDRKYHAEVRVTDNMMDDILCSSAVTSNAAYYSGVDRQVVGDGIIQRPDNTREIRTLIDPTISDCPFPMQQLKVSPLYDKLQEKRLYHQSESHRVESSRSLYEDATFTRTVPYVPEHPKFSHRYSNSLANDNGKSSLVQKNHYQRGPLENLYSSQIRSSPYFSWSKTSEDLDITSECADEALLADTSGQQNSISHKSSSPFLNSNPARQPAVETSAPVNYRGSVTPKLSSTSLPSYNQRNIEREKGNFAYPSVSSESHFAFDGNLASASLVGKCASWQERGMLITKEKQFSGISSHTNHKVHHKIFEGPHCNFSGNRRSVFTRLTSRQEPWFDKESSDINVDGNDCYLNASADEVMEMLQQGNNPRNMKNYKLVGKEKHGESAVDGKQIQSHTEIIPSRTDVKIDETHSAFVESVDEVPKETRIVSFKRRSDVKKSVVWATNDSTADNKTRGVNKVVESSTMKTLKRKRLVRPVFGKVGTTTDATCSNENLQMQVLVEEGEPNLEKAISSHKAEAPEDNQSASKTEEPVDKTEVPEDNQPGSKIEVQHNVLPSSSHELEGHETPPLDPQVDRGTSPLKQLGRT